MKNTSTATRQRRRPGRPPLPASRVKSIRMETLVDQSTLDKVQKEARRRGISQNEFVRQLIHNA